MALSPEPQVRSVDRIGQRFIFGTVLFIGACATIVDIREPILIEEQNGTGGSATSSVSSSSSSGESSSMASSGGAGGMGNGGAGGAGGAPTNLAKGTPCAADTECMSGFCVDGVCCGAICDGECESCSTILKGGGLDGDCGPTVAGFDPDNECVQGVCDGSGYCYKTPYDTTKYYKIVNEGCGKTADVGGTSTCDWKCDGQNVQQWVDYGGARQQWKLQLVAAGVYIIINKHSGKVLDVQDSSGLDGGNIHQWTYVGGNNQKWRLIDVGSGYYKLENVNSGKVMQVAGNVSTDGANIEQRASQAGALYQKWIFVQVP